MTKAKPHPEPLTIDLDLLRGMPLPDYDDEAHKADYGKLLLIAGSVRLAGAAVLAARAALRCGCGTVRVATPESVAVQLAVAVPELMVLPLPQTAQGTVAAGALPLLEAQYEPCDAVVIGPGLDEGDETLELVRQVVVGCKLPMLLDAQALVAFNAGKGRPPADFGKPPLVRVLTPHAGEMSGLIAKATTEVEAAREEIAVKFAHDHGVTLLLKGRHTLIASPDGGLHKNTAGTRGLGTAGSGDVLAGIIGGLLAQGLDGPAAATWGAHMHGLAGEGAAKDGGDDGLMARDLVDRLPQIIRYLRRQTSGRKDGERSGLRRFNAPP